MNRRIGFFVLVTAALNMATAVVAEDIEIYTATTGTGDAGEINPNIVFIMDSSGSMNQAVAVASGDFLYDPMVDYGDDGDADDDDLIYVYDTELNFTGLSFTQNQVVCQSMLDFHEDNEGFPLYNARALQWQFETTIVGGTTCDEIDASTTISFSGSASNGSSLFVSPTIDVDDIELGTEIVLQATNSSDRRARLYIDILIDGQWFTTGGCNGALLDDFQTRSCSVFVPSNFDFSGFGLTEIRGRVSRDGNSGSSIITDGTLTYNVGATTVDPTCIPSPGSPETTGQWQEDFRIPDESEEVLECEEDEGVHGLNDSSLDRYAAFCPDDNCVEPFYLSNASAGINWNSSGIDSNFFVPGNYHDFLTNVPEPVGAVIDADRDTYCAAGGQSASNLGNFFRDTDTGIIYQCQRKSAIMQAAANDLATTLENVNIGLMRFFDVDEADDNGGSVILAVDDIDAVLSGGQTQEQAFQSQINGLDFRTNTPLAETMSEAYRYFTGSGEQYGDDFVAGDIDDENAYDGSGDYVSPITHSCQSNNIVYLTDGEPVSDGGANNFIRNLTGEDNCGSSCLDELAEYMATNDLSGTIDGDNTVNTYTIGFDIDLDLLEDTADAGNGEYFIASDYRQLAAAFQSILIDIALSQPATLVAPAVSVNAFNELQNRDEIYYAVFEPAASPRWEGNVKKYRIENGVILDANDDPAIDGSGFFSETARSFWSDVRDGPNADVGGFREQLTNTRRVFVDGSVLATAQAGIVPLTDSTDLSPTSAGVASEAEAETIRDWILGEDVDDFDDDGDLADAHQYAAESLHSRPFVITYSGSSTANARDVLFVSTNAGFLHAIDARNNFGTELWTYIPSDLIGNAAQYLADVPSEEHVYGLDGSATIFTEQTATSSATNFQLETAIIYQGMRRGGRNYYAWDVSNAISPTGVPIEDLWTIRGGSGNFADLGQSWSKMVRSKISYGCNEAGSTCSVKDKDVLVFSGGYDTYYDNPDVLPRTASSGIDGNAVYVVDADTGALIWSAGDGVQHDLNIPMYNSIPADPSPVDIDGDGDMDILFVVDISGKIWRIDFNEQAASVASAGVPSDDDFTQGGVIADLADGSGFARFYNKLDISIATPRGGPAYFNLVVGSGYRAHPRDDESATNRVYVVYDNNLIRPLDENDDGVIEYGYAGGSAITQADLFQPTAATPAVAGESAVHGFFISFPSENEKLLQPTTTFNNRVFFATYLPEAGDIQDVDACGQGNTGGGRIYVFDLLSGEVIFNDNLSVDGIPNESTTLIQPAINVCFGTECFGATDPDSTTNDADHDGVPDTCENPQNVADALCFQSGRAYRAYWRENTQ